MPLTGQKGEPYRLWESTYLKQEVKSNVQSFHRLCGKCRAKGAVQETTVIGNSIMQQECLQLRLEQKAADFGGFQEAI